MPHVGLLFASVGLLALGGLWLQFEFYNHAYNLSTTKSALILQKNKIAR